MHGNGRYLDGHFCYDQSAGISTRRVEYADIMQLFYTDPRLEPVPRIWGPGVFDNDIGVKARDAYLEYLVNGRSDDEATRLTIEVRIRDPYDIDFKLLFWTALAETQWQVGRLDPAVAETAIEYIENGDGVTMHQRADLYPARDTILDELRRKLAFDAPPIPKGGDELIQYCRDIWGEDAYLHID